MSALHLHVIAELKEAGSFHVYDEVGAVESQAADSSVSDALLLSEFKKDFGHKSTLLAWNGKDIGGAKVATGMVTHQPRCALRMHDTPSVCFSWVRRWICS